MICVMQNTTDVTSMRAFSTLKQRLPTWEHVLAAPAADVEDAIRVGGLAAIKVERIKALLAALQQERGVCCLEWLRQEPSDNAVKTYLSQFKGIGPKTISCVLLFCLGRPDFAVDTHVHFIAQALHWIPKTASREQAYEHLNCLVPGEAFSNQKKAAARKYRLARLATCRGSVLTGAHQTLPCCLSVVAIMLAKIHCVG